MENAKESHKIKAIFDKRNIIILVLVLLLIIALLIMFWPEDKEVLSSSVVAGSLQDVSELTTQDYHYNVVGEYEDSREIFNKFKVPFTKKYFVYSFPGVIKFGFNMEELTEEDINIAGNTITITMPEVVILANDPNVEDRMYYAEDNNLINPFKPEDAKELEQEIEKLGEEEAIKSGAIKAAQDNAKLIFQTLFQSLPEYEGYEVICEFKEQTTVKHIEDVKK